MTALRMSSAAAVAARSAVVAASIMQPGAASTPPPPLKDALSGIFGSISLTAWICLLLPQLIQNYKAQSADGLSMAFLFVWLLGDATNLSGALLTGLAPTAVALASYFCVADIVLISQCLYYKNRNAAPPRRRRSSATAVDDARLRADAAAAADDAYEGDEDEQGPLLSRRRSSSIGLPGSHRAHVRRSPSHLDPLRRIITGEDETPDASPWVHNALGLLAVWCVGTAGYFASYRMGAWDADDPADDGSLSPAATDVAARVGLALGYASAVCYLCARVPQIIKNYREKSCEGLALLFFLLSLTGNLTYGASLIAYSQEPDYYVKALPWLLGSLGTVVEDCIIFVQFRLYAPKRTVSKTVSHATADTGAVGTYGAA